MPATPPFPRGADGFFHPRSEEQIVTLVQYARRERLKVRCRGAAHSVAWAIYTESARIPNSVSVQTPPPGPDVNIMLDRYAGLRWIDERGGVVEVDAGIRLGADPDDPTGMSTLRDGLLYQIYQKGWALSDLGGITHQTVGGFLGTGSAGGSLRYDLGENLLAFRVIDGTGNVRWVDRDTEHDLFCALGVSFGLLGIFSQVRLQLTRNFFIYGQQTTTPTTAAACAIDLFGPGTAGKPSLREFLERTPYTRILWWPQSGVERVVIWEAVRGAAIPVFDPIPYTQFADTTFLTLVENLFGAILFTVLDNPGVLGPWRKLRRDFAQFRSLLKRLWTGKARKPGGKALAWLVATLVNGVARGVTLLFTVLRPLVRWLYPKIIGVLQPLTKPGKSPTFMDYMWRSLPMDNEADDVLLGTEFTELWTPVEHTERVMRLLRDYYAANGVRASGYYATELYAGHRSEFWMSPAYGGPQFRIDPFRHINAAGAPAAKGGFFAGFWELLRAHDVPFRLHWGKFLPDYDHRGWAEYFRSRYPHWDDFLALRARRDPDDIFLTDYWRRQLYGEDPGRSGSGRIP